MARQTLVVQMDRSDQVAMNQFYSNFFAGMQDMTPFWDAVEMYMIDSLTKNFESEGRPIRWEPLAPWTIEEKGSSTILQDTGALKNSINASNTEQQGDTLDIWAGDIKGLFHQYVDLDPMSQFGMMNKNERYPMPMRPFMLFQEQDKDEIERIGERYLEDITQL